MSRAAQRRAAQGAHAIQAVRRGMPSAASRKATPANFSWAFYPPISLRMAPALRPARDEIQRDDETAKRSRPNGCGELEWCPHAKPTRCRLVCGLAHLSRSACWRDDPPDAAPAIESLGRRRLRQYRSIPLPEFRFCSFSRCGCPQRAVRCDRVFLEPRQPAEPACDSCVVVERSSSR
jgi:hypothetical protein